MREVPYAKMLVSVIGRTDQFTSEVPLIARYQPVASSQPRHGHWLLPKHTSSADSRYNWPMSTPILTTKLYLPPLRPDVVLRSRLIARLSAGLHRKLTLICAPAGFGKTTLLSAWLADCGRPSAWLSLDEADSDPSRFLAYLVAALRTIVPTIGETALAVLQSPQPPIDAFLSILLNEIATLPQPAILVLDDYHLLDARPIDQALAFLVERLPPQLHLVIATRVDPPLPLARLRTRGQLTEVRAADLRFTSVEVTAFLTEVMGLNLAAQDIAVLEARTEGWIAGLQLAALSMQGHQDVGGFIQAFAGDHRYILDYLAEEVLQRQPETIRNFLLQTAILDCLSGSLCDAVSGQMGGNARLEALDRGNFFVVPLDDRRQWYRYHHLFAEVLQAHLRAEQPDLVAVLHRRASVWYEQHGAAVDAIRHALAAEDFGRAADLLELAVPALRNSRQEAAVLSWLSALPDELVHRRPVLSVAYAWALLAEGQLDGVEERLRSAERWLDPTADQAELASSLATGMVVVDDVQFRHLPGTIAVFRAGQALALGHVAETVTYAKRALELVPEEDHLQRGAAMALLGLAAWTSGDLEAAHRSYADGMARMERAGIIAQAIGCVIALADIRITQGRLREALRTYAQGLELAAAQGHPILRGAADMHVGLSELLCEQNDLPAATEHLMRTQVLGEHMGLPQNPYRWRVVMARIKQAHGDLEGALALLEEAQRRYVGDFFPNVRPVAALVARLWVAQGRLGDALGWVRAQGLSAEDDLSYLREFNHITLARVLLAHAQSEGAGHSIPEAIHLLARLLAAAEAGERTGRVIEILILQALAHQMQGDIPAALEPLSRALTLAEREGYVRLFVDEGSPMAYLLQEALARGIQAGYVEKLLAAFLESDKEMRHGDKESDRASLSPVSQSPGLPVSQSLVEPLSQRELEVLRLFNTELSGPEIARELVIGLSTVRTYTKSIYTKLNVNSRRAAVRRAAELGLI
jgi:LuxR family transcriptional regulator, maltose regulon positive regulatory protein